MKHVRVCVVTGFGINADRELAEAFLKTGGRPERVHINDLIVKPELMEHFEIIAFPGGFSFGDHLGSGKVFASLFKKHLQGSLIKFLEQGKLVIGICNGFQVLVKMGMLPNLNKDWAQEVSLIHNDSGIFEDRWVTCRVNTDARCVWTKGLSSLELPVRHGEGKFVVKSPEVRRALSEKGLIALTYAGKDGEPTCYPANPNGSELDIAGISDTSGRVFGLMPHPEAFLIPYNHPRWTREKIFRAWGLAIFERGIQFIKRNTR
jgi:phosphoribosylformylglycinamidine synthase